MWGLDPATPAHRRLSPCSAKGFGQKIEQLCHGSTTQRVIAKRQVQ